ncbi:imelysin family protein [Marinagarivorans cellulosilyticus]|uniref:Imelysin-like domain-containing protein n=1 Tax=Marinagarivorans cellulosilyticus TaxID=2721545 RepID=A0AAN1WLD9_9GAMM|nr:imelysin family protein [Marinagarivorans cellulosilyticus]BCD99725.1 hypothetical protein MARGE09_P3927 [Marinagarivorans cellulosilyticus]
MPLLRRFRMLMLAALCGGALIGCGSDGPAVSSATTDTPSPSQPLPLVAPHNQTITLWQNQQLQISNAISQAQALEQQLQQLLKEPDAEHLLASQQQWLLAADAIEALALIGPLGRATHNAQWREINQAFDFISVWPAQLGYLDENEQHGKTGLIYDIDTAINAENLRHQHGLTHVQDASLGIYPLGLILWGAGDNRVGSDFTQSQSLNESELRMGYSSTHELANNRRRQLIQLQAQLLVEDLTQLHAAWARRDRNSAINAISQASIEEQHSQHVKAALDLLTQQLLELKSAPYNDGTHNEPSWNLERRNKRWQTQLQQLAHWLALLDINYLAEPILQLQQVLSAQYANADQAGENLPRPADSDIEAKLATMALALKKTIENRPQP